MSETKMSVTSGAVKNGYVMDLCCRAWRRPTAGLPFAAAVGTMISDDSNLTPTELRAV